MPARLLAVGTFPLVRTDDGRLISWKGRHSFETFVGEPSLPLRVTQAQTPGVVRDLVTHWGYSPFFDADGTLGIPLPSTFYNSYPAWETLYLPGGRTVAALVGLEPGSEDDTDHSLTSWLGQEPAEASPTLFDLCCPAAV